MIVISTGTHHQAFGRLIDESMGWQQPVFYQGAGSVSGHLRLAEADLFERMQKASVVIIHAAPGSIALARRAGHRPLIVPRDPHFAEHVDDHQRRYASSLTADQGTVVWHPQTLRWLVSGSTRAEPHAVRAPPSDFETLRKLLG